MHTQLCFHIFSCLNVVRCGLVLVLYPAGVIARGGAVPDERHPGQLALDRCLVASGSVTVSPRRIDGEMGGGIYTCGFV